MTNSKRQPYIKGGVASLRQPFFLGKIAKKIGRGVKKIVKSPIGKAALIGGGLYGLNKWGPLAGKITGKGTGGNWLSKGIGWGKNLVMGTPATIAGETRREGGLWNLMKKYPGRSAMLGLGAAGMALPFFAGKDEEEEDDTPWDVTPSSIANIRNMARNRDPSLAFLPPENYTQAGYYLANGGIAGLANGGGAANAQAEQMIKMQYQK